MPTFTSVATSDFASGLGTDWAQLNTALAGDIQSSGGVYTGQFGEQPTGEHAMARWVGSGTFTDAQYSEVVGVQWLAFGSSHTMGPTVQMTSGTGAAKTGYELYCKSVTGGELYIIKWSAGARTVLVGPITQSLANGDALMLADNAGVLTGYVNRTAVSGLTYTDSSPLTGGKPGISASGTSMQGTSVEMGNVTAPASVLGGNVTLDDATPGGGLSSVASSLGGNVTLDDVAPSGTLGAAPGRIRLLGINDEWRDKAGNLLASKACTVDVDNPATGGLLARITTTTDAGGLIPEISHGALAQSMLYRIDVLFGTGEYGVVYRTSEAT